MNWHFFIDSDTRMIRVSGKEVRNTAGFRNAILFHDKNNKQRLYLVLRTESQSII